MQVVSLKAARTLKECRKLFTSFQARLNTADGPYLGEMLKNYTEESKKFPEHLLTIVKGEMIVGRAIEVLGPTEGLTKELDRLKKCIEKRLTTLS